MRRFKRYILEKSWGILYILEAKCLRLGAPIIFVLVSCPILGQVKQKIQLSSADYPLWGTLQLDKISEKGKWVSYNMQYEQQTDTLFLQNTVTKKTTSFPKGTNGKFNKEDSFACVTPAGLVWVNLNTGKQQFIPQAIDFAFSANVKYILVLKNDSKNQRVLEIRTSNGEWIQGLKEVTTFILNEAEDKVLCFIKSDATNAVILLNLDETLTKKVIIEDSKSIFTNGTWDSSGTAVAFFQESIDSAIEKNTKLIYYNGNENKPITLSLENQPSIPKEMQMDAGGTVKLTISQDGQKVFFGIKDKTQIAAKSDSESVQIWKASDNWIYPQQKDIKNWKQTVKTAVWWPAKNQCRQITTNEFPMLMLDGKQQYALIYNPIPSKPQYTYDDDTDLYGKNLETGECSLWIEKHSGNINHTLASPNGQYIAYFKNSNWWLFDIATKTHRNLTERLGINCEDADYDNAGEIPAYGIAGWTKNDKSILIYDKYDIWEITPDGKAATRLTTGKEKQICFRIPKKMDGTWNKQNCDGLISNEVDLENGLVLQAKGDNLFSGYFTWNRKQREKAIVYTNSQIDQILKASKSNTYVFREQKYDSPPTVLIKDESKNKPQIVFESNPQHKKYEWGKSELIYYHNSKGKILKGILYYPAGYDSNKKYPMIVHIYERQSNELHNYVNPSELDSTGFNITNFTSQGYFVLLPDIQYEIGNPGTSALDCVVTATQSIIDKGLVLPNKIGLIGHSFGGYETSFIVTQTNIFATAIAGASATDLTSWYLTVGWNTGRPEIWRFESQQWRMGKSLFEDLESYNRNSPILHTKQVKTPLLLWTGEEDKQVNSNQSIEFYLALRRLEKQATMLVYPKERHALLNEANQKDLTEKISDWFDYYLKDKEKSKWMKMDEEK
jgi:dipeptidyl aminopeptidase/acylaminoacyl peptidase